MNITHKTKKKRQLRGHYFRGTQNNEAICQKSGRHQRIRLKRINGNIQTALSVLIIRTYPRKPKIRQLEGPEQRQTRSNEEHRQKSGPHQQIPGKKTIGSIQTALPVLIT